MKIVAIVAAIVAALWVMFAVLNWLYPEALVFIAKPIVPDGPSLFKMFQATALVGGALVTLWLTHRRTEAISKQADTVNNQLLHVQDSEAREQFNHTIELISGKDSNELSRTAGIAILLDFLESSDDDKRIVAFRALASLITTRTRKLTYDVLEKITAIQNNDRDEIAWDDFPSSDADVIRAIYAITRVRNNIQRDFKAVVNTFYVSNLRFNDNDFENLTLKCVMFNCRFEECNFRGAVFLGTIFVNCKFVQCNFTGAKVVGKGHGTCVFENCAVDDAEVDLRGEWVIEKNHHCRNSPPRDFKPDDLLYEHDIEEAMSNNEGPLHFSERPIPKLVISNN